MTSDAGRLASLTRFIQAARTARELEDLLGAALNCVEESLGSCCAAVLLSDEGRLSLRVFRDGQGLGEPGQVCAMASAEMARRALREQKLVVVQDGATLVGQPLRHQGRLIRALVAIPLQGMELPGVLCLGSYDRQGFHEEELQVLTLVAERLGLALEAERRREAEQRSRVQLEAVRTAALLLAEPVALSAALQRIVEQVRLISLAEYAALGILSDGGQRFEPWVFTGLSEEQARSIGQPPHPVGLLGEVPATGQVVRIADARQDHRYQGVPSQHPPIRSFLGIPITLRGERVGNLYLANKSRAKEFSKEDELAVQLLAQHAAIAVESARAHERTQRDMEELRRTHSALQESEERLLRTFEDAPIGMAMLDLEGRFLRVNRVLCEISGRTAEELLGLRFQDITHPEDLELVLLENERLLRGESSRFELAKRYLRKDGSIVHLKLSSSLIRDERRGALHFISQFQDVTKQQRVEQEMLVSERRFRALFDNALEGILILDNQGICADANPGACAILRLPRAAMIGKPLLQLANEGTPEQFQERWQQLLAQGEYRGESRLRQPDGHILEVEYSVRAHFVPGEHLAIIRDITQRKRSEAALRRSEALLRLVLESLPVGVWIADENGKILQGNPAGQRIWGGVRHVGPERYGEYKGWWADTGKRIAAAEWGMARAVRNAESSFGEVLHIETFDGKRKTIQVSSLPMRSHDGKIIGALSVNEDITERIQVERELKLLAEASAVLGGSLELDTMIHGVARVAAAHLGDWCVIDLLEGEEFRRATGAHRRPEQDGPVRELLRHPPGLGSGCSFTRRLLSARQAVSGKVPPEILTAYLVDERHQEVLKEIEPHSYLAVPLATRDRVLGILTIFSMDPERRYEAGDHSAATELGRRVALAIENARLQVQTQRAHQTRKEMVAIVSHDLRNPLTAISLLAAGIEQDAERENAPGIAADARSIQHAAEQMERLIRDMLDLAAIEAGRLTIQSQPEDLGRLLEEAREMLTPLAEQRRVSLRIHSPGSPISLQCDRNRALQVISNLCGNALKFTPEGGTVTVRAAPEGDDVLISVSDTGKGISPEELPHIFDRYWRAKGSEQTAGVGLGLAIVKGIVEAHGGSIRAESRQGEGSTFFVSLPVSGPRMQPRL
jgi:PAS domain S-box-containing protein